jgi:hypothetical protein
VANSICPYLQQHVFTSGGVVDFQRLFLVPCAAAIVAAILLVICFHPPKQAVSVR